ncbi:sialin-like isoform X2 [Branchiostoma lanceolatum]|uniref:sialin-like isoform X2 n=1 Tax=Branchiostoma lanceolatum TaxID=7740 RepID=UPI0034555D1E
MARSNLFTFCVFCCLLYRIFCSSRLPGRAPLWKCDPSIIVHPPRGCHKPASVKQQQRHNLLKMNCCIPARYSLVVLLIGVTIHFFTLRSHFSIIIVAMVEHSPHSDGNNTLGSECYVNTSRSKLVTHKNNVTEFGEPTLYTETGTAWQGNSTEDRHKNKFSWDPITQGRILGAYAYGHIFSQVLGGFLEARFGGKKVLGLSILLSSVLTLFTPVAAFTGEWWLFFDRVLVGFVQGVIYPSIFGILSKWAPPSERGLLLAIVMIGDTFGVFVGFSLTAYLITQFGWAATLYATGVAGLPLCCMWCLLAFDSPAVHPRITKAERTYIESNLEKMKKGRNIPWLKMLTSPHLWVLIYIHCAESWSYYLILTCLPLYMDTILNFNIDTNGGLSALPYLSHAASSILTSLILDPVIKKSTFKKVNIRKASVLGLTVIAVCLVAVGHVRCDSTAAIALLCLAVTMRGVMIPGFYPSYTELTLGFSGVAYGISNSLANCSGFLAPLMVGILPDENQTIAAWQKVFYIGAAISVSGSVMALAFHRTDPVSWARDPDEDELSHPARDKLILDSSNDEKTDTWPVLVYESTV